MYPLRSEISRKSGSAFKDCDVSSRGELFWGLANTAQAMKPNAKAIAKVQGSRIIAFLHFRSNARKGPTFLQSFGAEVGESSAAASWILHTRLPKTDCASRSRRGVGSADLLDDGYGKEFTARMFEAINGMLLDMLAAVARKDYDDRRRRRAQGQAKAKAEGRYRAVQKIASATLALPTSSRKAAPGALFRT